MLALSDVPITVFAGAKRVAPARRMGTRARPSTPAVAQRAQAAGEEDEASGEEGVEAEPLSKRALRAQTRAANAAKSAGWHIPLLTGSPPPSCQGLVRNRGHC